MPSCTPRPRSRTPRPSKNTLQQLNQTCRRQRSVAPASTRWNHTSPPAASPPLAHRSRRRRRAAQHDGPLARNHASRPPLTAVVPQQMQRKPADLHDASKTRLDAAVAGVSGTEPSQKRVAATQHPTKRILLGTRDTSPTVESLQGPTRRRKTTNSPRPSQIPPGPRSINRYISERLAVHNLMIDGCERPQRARLAGARAAADAYHARTRLEQISQVQPVGAVAAVEHEDDVSSRQQPRHRCRDC